MKYFLIGKIKFFKVVRNLVETWVKNKFENKRFVSRTYKVHL